jgi:TctA family transporter
VLEIPRPLLYSGILVFVTLGVYSLSGSIVEVLVMYAIGVMGFFMRRYEFPIAPVILGVILGPVIAVALPYLPLLLARVRGRERSVSTRWAFGDGD